MEKGARAVEGSTRDAKAEVERELKRLPGVWCALEGWRDDDDDEAALTVAVAAQGRRLMGLERNSCALCSSALFGACLPRLFACC
ncbi:hypothetical protein PVAP13_8KG275610 [Panicum virgatum]|uniref:Uncharacterized protein n=1 Tax=Panicum virgatum TaxID=38727 RepID=A0A8T0PJJ9_PANVG|nr:hypothetical protein PVAP13_8KG275610 [Panicum virgatum]